MSTPPNTHPFLSVYRTMKQLIRRSICSLSFRHETAIVVASTGRAGSTMLFNAIAKSLIRERFHLRPERIPGRLLWRASAGFVPRLREFDGSWPLVAKTHDLFQNAPDIPLRLVFIYGDPLDAALSVRDRTAQLGRHWFERHQHHLQGSGSLNDLFSADVLNYEGQMRSWLGTRDERVYCVDLDDLWLEISSLSRFLGFPVTLQPRHAYTEKVIPPSIDRQLFDELRSLKRELKRAYIGCRQETQTNQASNIRRRNTG